MSASSDAALVAQRRMTEQYIQMDPTTISLIPRVRVKTPGGEVHTSDGTPRDPQDFKLIVLSSVAPLVRVDDGVERIIEYVLLGAYDSIMEPGDHWIGTDGRRYTVITMEGGHGYEKKGEVEARG